MSATAKNLRDLSQLASQLNQMPLTSAQEINYLKKFLTSLETQLPAYAAEVDALHRFKDAASANISLLELENGL